ncbi:hypothetical protein D3C80_2049850 [compost metagenome]
MYGLLPPVGPVHNGRFIQMQIDGGKRRQIHDGAVAEFLPRIGEHQRKGKPVFVAQEEDRLHSEEP